MWERRHGRVEVGWIDGLSWYVGTVVERLQCSLIPVISRCMIV